MQIYHQCKTQQSQLKYQFQQSDVDFFIKEIRSIPQESHFEPVFIIHSILFAAPLASTKFAQTPRYIYSLLLEFVQLSFIDLLRFIINNLHLHQIIFFNNVSLFLHLITFFYQFLHNFLLNQMDFHSLICSILLFHWVFQIPLYLNWLEISIFLINCLNYHLIILRYNQSF